MLDLATLFTVCNGRIVHLAFLDGQSMHMEDYGTFILHTYTLGRSSLECTQTTYIGLTRDTL